MEVTRDLFGNQGRHAAGAVVDGEAALDLVLYGLFFDLGYVLDHLHVQHAGIYFVKREGRCAGFPITDLWREPAPHGVPLDQRLIRCPYWWLSAEFSVYIDGEKRCLPVPIYPN